MQNHYYTLGLAESASAEDIKIAFKTLAVKYHPDKHMGDKGMEEKFKSVNQAYQILSDPYKKAQFDLQLQYEHFARSQKTAQTSRPNPYQHQPPRKRYGGRPNYSERPINKKENNKATLYAFGLTFCVALMVMLIKGAYDMYLERKYEDYLAERREVFHQAQVHYDNDEIRKSMLLLSDLTPFKPEELDMKEFHIDKMEDITFRGDDYYLNKDFENAIRYFELVEQFSPYRPMAMRARLAQSYRYVDKPEISIRKLKELIEENYRVIATLNQIAEVYSEELHDLETSRDYLELARDVAVRDYQTRFGKAYMLVVSQDFIPMDHYYMYKNLAELYNRTDQPEESLGSTNWMKRIWPDSVSSYRIAAISHLQLDNETQACREYQTAQELGLVSILPETCQ